MVVRVLAQSLLLLLVAVTMTGAAPAHTVATFSVVLRYPRESRAPEASRVFRSHGKTYRFRLRPESDVHDDLVGFALVLERASRSWRGSNLLDPTGRVHGYQKWTFAASDFVHGPGKSLGGITRTVNLPNLGLTVQIDVVRSAVKPTPATSDMPVNYRFTSLTLEVRARTTRGLFARRRKAAACADRSPDSG